MNQGGFSWKRLLGISAFKSKIARKTGIPFTRSGRQRKLGAFIEKLLMSFFNTPQKRKRR